MAWSYTYLDHLVIQHCMVTMQSAGVATFNENYCKVVEETKSLQAQHKQTKIQLRRITDEIETMQAAVAEATANKEAGS